jgi:hypothetical protein
LFGAPHPLTINPLLQWQQPCYTVCQRYASAAAAQQHQARHIKQHQHYRTRFSDNNVNSRHHVVLLTLHKGSQYTPEFMVHISSLIAEAWPMHVRFLYHCGHAADMQLLPTQLRQRAFPYTDEAVRSTYFFRSSNHTHPRVPVWNIRFCTDLPVILFMMSHPLYQFVWAVEDDV